MDLSVILQAITTVGFPIVMCIALFWYMVNQNKTHSEETKQLQEAIVDMRVAITELTETIRKDGD